MTENSSSNGRVHGSGERNTTRNSHRLIPATARDILVLLLSLAAIPLARSATIVWNGPGAGANNWSIPGNWAGSVVPGGGDDVKFFDPGATTVSNIDNVVDGGFGGFIGSLQYGNTNNNHTTLIGAALTLNITNTGGLTAGTLTDNGNAEVVNATITGPGGTLALSNSAANLVVDQGRSANGNGTQRATLDLSGLGTFVANINRIGVGTTTLGGSANAQNATGTLKLAQTNIITTSFVGTPISVGTTATPTNSIDVGSDNGNAGGVDFLYLGQTNAFFIDSIGVGELKATATMLFNAGLANPAAYFRGAAGGGSRIRFWTIGDMSSSGSSSSTATGTNDFSGGTVDALVDTMSLARDRQGGNTGTTATRGTLTFVAGTIDANTLLIGNQQFTNASNTNAMIGVFNINGASATLRVNTVLTLGRTTTNSTAAIRTSGTLNVTNGTVLANNITVGPFSTTNAINLVNASLIVSNTLATNSAAGLGTLSLSNSILGLTVPANASLVGLVQSLNAAGPTNLIQLDPVPVIFSSYPQQFALIKYSAWNGANNFGLAAIPVWAPGAVLVSNGPNKSLDLLLPSNPGPVITSEPSGYSGNPGDNVTTNFAVAIAAASVTPLSYQWYYYTNGASATNLLSDGPGPSGFSILTGSATATLLITNAQPADNGNYFVVVTNAYGDQTSSVAVLNISAGCSAPNIIGPVSQTVIQGNNAGFSASVSANPAAALRWQRNGSDIPGATSSTLIVTNVQYPADDQSVFCLIATNACGDATNCATLTVIVPPTISVQPASLVVTNTLAASFSVTASGVPTPWYQWNKNGSPISSATNATFTIANASPSDMGSYSVTITNLAGTTNSVSVTLTVNSSNLFAVALSPANGENGVAYDTPLYITFNQTPLLTNTAKIRIYDATNGATPVDTLDLSQGIVQARTIAGESFNTYPVIITGSTAAIYPHLDVLSSNQTYYVIIDDGVFTDTNGAYFPGINATNAWQFTTKPSGPINPTNLVVAQDYSGDFATVQGALDSVPANNNTPTLISIRDGLYTEVVDIHSKSNLTLRGQSRKGTILGYANNAAIAAGGSTHFRMAFKVNANDIALDNLTVTNMTPQDSSQAEALMIESGAQRIIVNNADLDSYQDTVLANQSTSKAYFNNSLIQGDVDFIWGGGNLFFTNCEVRWLARQNSGQALGPNPSPSATDLGSNGFSFVNCALTTVPGATNNAVGRTRSITNGNTALINCLVSTNIGGWAADALPTNLFRNWYFSCSNLSATASVTLSNGVPLAANDPNVANAGSATIWLYGWQPQLGPNILIQPVGQSVAGGQPVTLSVGATGIPDPSYQWLENGSPIPGATGATFIIANAYASNAAVYSVIVSNVAGSLTSSNAAVAVGNTAPALAPVSDQTVNVGVIVLVTNVASDPDVPPQILTFSLPIAPLGATLDPTSGIFDWRPPVSAANSSNLVQVVVTDNGSPNLSATNTFQVIVNPLTQPNISLPSYSGGQFSLSISGETGPDYALQASTNLLSTNWTTILRTNSPPSPFTLIDTNAGAQPAQFYRIIVGPPLP